MKQALKLIGVFLISGAVGFILAVVGIIIFTDTTLEEYFNKLLSINWLELVGVGLFSLAAFALSVFMQIILHETGHLVCGVATGYKFVSFRILDFTIIKTGGKFCIKRFKIAGTGGQCLLSPPNRPAEDVPCILYNAGGFIANLLASAVAFILMCGDTPALLNVALLLFGLTGLFLALVNGIPMKIGGMGNDGYNMLMLERNPESKRSMVIQLKANALAVEGVTPSGMLREWFADAGDTEAMNVGIPENFDYSNALALNTELMKVSFIMDLDDNTLSRIEQAHALLVKIYSHKDQIMKLFLNETVCELLFTSLATGRRELAVSLYTDEVKKYIDVHKKVMSSKQRILWAIAYYLDNNKKKAAEICSNILLHRNSYLMQGEVKMDIALIERLCKLEIG